MSYIDGFVIPVANTKRDAYRAHELKWWPSFQKMGATQMVIGWGEDVTKGKQTDFLRSVEAKSDETVVLCWMIWPDKETRNTAYKAMEDRAKIHPDEFAEMPFDGKRMIFGGFTPILIEGTTL